MTDEICAERLVRAHARTRSQAGRQSRSQTLSLPFSSCLSLTPSYKMLPPVETKCDVCHKECDSMLRCSQCKHAFYDASSAPLFDCTPYSSTRTDLLSLVVPRRRPSARRPTGRNTRWTAVLFRVEN